jgi:metallo-beta-lactamase family protein
MSSHADSNELIGWLKSLAKAPRKVFVAHGEPTASDALRQRIEHELGWNAIVPDYRDEVEV